jgi:hypothetical protein
MFKTRIAKTHFGISTAPSIVETQSLKTEKTKLVELVKNYLKKKSDRKTTLDGLTSLRESLPKPA